MLAWLKKFWWVVLAALAFIAGLFLRGGRATPQPPTYSADAERETLKHEAEAASQVAEVEKSAEKGRAKIEEVSNVRDDRDRLQRLADMVNREEVSKK